MRPICIFKPDTKDQPKPIVFRQDSLENTEDNEETTSEENPEESRKIVSRLISRFETEFPTNKRSFPLSKSKSFSVKDKKRPVVEKRTQDDSLYNTIDSTNAEEEEGSSSFHVKDLLSKFENFKAKHFKLNLKKKEKSEEERLNERIEDLEKTVNAQLAAFKKLYEGWENDVNELLKTLQKSVDFEEKYKLRVDNIINNLNTELNALIATKALDNGFDEVDGDTDEIVLASIPVREIKTKFERQSSASSNKQSPAPNDSLQSANLITSYFNRLNGSTQQEANENTEKPVREDDEIEEYSLEANHVKQLTNVFEKSNLNVNEEESEEDNGQNYEEKYDNDAEKYGNDPKESNTEGEEVKYDQVENDEIVQENNIDNDRYIPYKEHVKIRENGENKETEASIVEAAQNNLEISEEKPDDENKAESLTVATAEEQLENSEEKTSDEKQTEGVESRTAPETLENSEEKINDENQANNVAENYTTNENKSPETEEQAATQISVVDVKDFLVSGENQLEDSPVQQPDQRNYISEEQTKDTHEQSQSRSDLKSAENEADRASENVVVDNQNTSDFAENQQDEFSEPDIKEEEIPLLPEAVAKEKIQEFIVAEQQSISA